MCMKKIIVYLFLIGFISGCSKDDSHADFLLETLFENNDKRLLDYYAVKNEDKVLSWNEEFDNNNSKWPLDVSTVYSDATVSIEDGKMIIDGYWENEYAVVPIDIPVTIDENKNFELEMRMYWRPNIVIYKFDSPLNTTEYYLSFITDYYVDKKDSIKEKEVIAWRYWGRWSSYDKEDRWQSEINVLALNYITFYDYNVTTIRKIGKKYSIFINGKYFYTISQEHFSCNPTKMVINYGINKFDYFRVYYLP